MGYYKIINKNSPELIKKFGLKDSNANKFYMIMRSV